MNLDGISKLGESEGPQTQETKDINLAIPKTEANTDPKALIAWQGKEGNTNKKGLWWFVAASFFMLAVSGYFIWQEDWFSLIIGIIVFSILIWYIKNTQEILVNYQISPIGVYVNERLYPFSEIHSFWLVYNQKVQKLNIVFIKKYLPALQMDVSSLNPVTLKAVLLRYVPEQEKRGESILDAIVRTLGL